MAQYKVLSQNLSGSNGENRKIFNQYILPPDRNMYPEPSEYKAKIQFVYINSSSHKMNKKN
jgi:hypothetical protein